ncbi:MAG: hypothetical protein E3K37_04190 [Candidatus Kuenenia sp.]|nr:hypothetical protein [Candidatus Kuenenia hertensis]
MKLYRIQRLFLFAIVLSGCASTKTIVQRSIWEDTSTILNSKEGKAQNLSIQEIKDVLITNNSKLVTLRTKAKITFISPESKGPVTCTGLILYETPNHLRAIGSKLATTIFDMSTDGNNFWVHIPSEKKVYTGSCNALHKENSAGIGISPEDMALLFNFKDILGSERTLVEIWPYYWVVHAIDTNEGKTNLKGKLLIDRINADTFRCETFYPDGTVRLQAVFTNYFTFETCRLPQRIDVRWPLYNTSLGITLSDIVVNNQLDPKIFTPAIPNGVEIVYLKN